jgi:hypothetical protein
MDQRLSDRNKWNDDWFLTLPPTMKCAWEYILDNCKGGSGFLKMSFRKMSDLIGAEITRESFDEHLGSRIHWVSEDTIWIAGFIKNQFKRLSPNNRAHVNMARIIVETIGDQQLSERSQRYFDEIKAVYLQTLAPDENKHEESIDNQERVNRPSTEGRETCIGNRVKGIGNREKGKGKEEGSGEKETIQPTEPPTEPRTEPRPESPPPSRPPKEPTYFDRASALYREVFPGTTTGTNAKKRWAEQVRHPDQALAVIAAIGHYRAFLEHPSNSWRKPKTSFETFLGTKSSGFFWQDFRDLPEMPPAASAEADLSDIPWTGDGGYA